MRALAHSAIAASGHVLSFGRPIWASASGKPAKPTLRHGCWEPWERVDGCLPRKLRLRTAELSAPHWNLLKAQARTDPPTRKTKKIKRTIISKLPRQTTIQNYKSTPPTDGVETSPANTPPPSGSKGCNQDRETKPPAIGVETTPGQTTRVNCKAATVHSDHDHRSQHKRASQTTRPDVRRHLTPNKPAKQRGGTGGMRKRHPSKTREHQSRDRSRPLEPVSKSTLGSHRISSLLLRQVAQHDYQPRTPTVHWTRGPSPLRWELSNTQSLPSQNSSKVFGRGFASRRRGEKVAHNLFFCAASRPASIETGGCTATKPDA